MCMYAHARVWVLVPVHRAPPTLPHSRYDAYVFEFYSSHPPTTYNREPSKRQDSMPNVVCDFHWPCSHRGAVWEVLYWEMNKSVLLVVELPAWSLDLACLGHITFFFCRYYLSQATYCWDEQMSVKGLPQGPNSGNTEIWTHSLPISSLEF